jgi:hypothetical protein
MVAAAIYATQLGIDQNSDWGPSRRLLLVAGSLLVLGAHRNTVFQVLNRGGEKFGTWISAAWESAWNDPAASTWRINARRQLDRLWIALGATPPVRLLVNWIIFPISRLFRAAWSTRLVKLLIGSEGSLAQLTSWSLFFLICVVYVWIVSVGRWTNWPESTHLFSLLGDAFRQGQTHLLVQPDPALLALSDPYEVELREQISTLWDISLYEGKFYLYWGPSPALILATLQLLGLSQIGDQYLVFGFVAGTFLFSVLLLLALWREYFSDLPWWTVIPGVLIVGLATPMPWLLNRPAVYEAAISGGQFFLIGGLYLVVLGLATKKPIVWMLTLAGTSWALAVGSRATLAPAVILFAGMVALAIVYRARGFKRTRSMLIPVLAFAAPLILGAVLHGWYNAERFDSVLELGHRYQLGRWNKSVQYDSVFSIDNLFPSLYNYFMNPPRTLNVFPFVKPRWGEYYIWPLRMEAPEDYYTEQVTGLLYSVPAVLFSAVAVFNIGRGIWPRPLESPDVGQDTKGRSPGFLLSWLTLTLAGGALLLLLPIVVHVSATMRHLADVVPTLCILSIIGFWLGYRSFSGRPGSRYVYLLFAWLVTLATAAMGLLLAVTGYAARFENLNPVLFDKITRLLAW